MSRLFTRLASGVNDMVVMRCNCKKYGRKGGKHKGKGHKHGHKGKAKSHKIKRCGKKKCVRFRKKGCKCRKR